MSKLTPATAAPRGSRASSPRRSPALKLALAFDALFAVLFLAFVLAASVFGQRGGETFSDNWYLAGPAIGAAAAALGGGAVALMALVRGSRERDLAIPLSIGGIVLFFLVGELAFPH